MKTIVNVGGFLFIAAMGVLLVVETEARPPIARTWEYAIAALVVLTLPIAIADMFGRTPKTSHRIWKVSLLAVAIVLAAIAWLWH